MNRHERRALFGAIEEMSKKIVLEPDWELRWDAFSGCMQGAADFGLPQAGELMKEFGGNLAKRVIDRLGAPCVGEIYQSLLYFLSADPAHHAASLAWQFSHQSEVLTLQENNPDIPLLERVGEGVMLILEIAAGVALAPVVLFGALWLATAVVALPLAAVVGLSQCDRDVRIGIFLFSVTLVAWLAL